MKKVCFVSIILSALSISSLSAQSVAISIGIRETGGSGPAFANGGTANGIEWVNRDGQSLLLNDTWQLFTFTPATDPLLAFAGTTANSVLEPGLEWAVLEHIRILNSDGITAPIRVWIDDVANTTSTGTVSEGFELFGLGTEVIFQEPSFSGSTSANLVPGSTALVSGSAAFAGTQSDELNFQFVDGTPTRWVRLTTFNAMNQLPNPAVRVREPGAPNPTISFYAKAVVIPEPSSMALGLMGFGLLAWLKRRGC